MDVVRALSDQERRARLARRHAIDPAARVLDAVDAVRAMTVLHATEPATVYLSLHARVDGLTRADVDRALYEERTLVKQLAMRRTLFVFPRDLLPAAWGSASARTAGAEGRRLVRDAVRAGLDADGAAWLAGARARVLAHLSDRPDGVPAVEVGPLLPELAGRVEVTRGPGWNHTRVLTHLGATGDAVRGVNTSHWRVFRPRWVRMGDWLGEVPAALARRRGTPSWSRAGSHTFGPGTTDDLVWWLGSTRSDAVAALEALGAVAVTLEDGRPGWVLPGRRSTRSSPSHRGPPCSRSSTRR